MHPAIFELEAHFLIPVHLDAVRASFEDRDSNPETYIPPEALISTVMNPTFYLTVAD
jgi:hypothetical protein